MSSQIKYLALAFHDIIRFCDFQLHLNFIDLFILENEKMKAELPLFFLF